MTKRPSKTRRLKARAFREVHRNEPERVAQTRRARGHAAAEAQRTAIALGKARKRGARIPKKQP